MARRPGDWDASTGILTGGNPWLQAKERVRAEWVVQGPPQDDSDDSAEEFQPQLISRAAAVAGGAC
jgi:hypothetical protein